MTRAEQIDAALKLLDPPRGERENWRKHIEEALNWQQTIFQNNADELKWAGSKEGKKALTRYVKALDEARRSYALLNPSIRGFLSLEMSSIEHDLVEAKAMQTHYSRPRKRPINKTAKAAVRDAGMLLIQCGLQAELDKTRKGKWHELAKVLADTRSDLRHYMDQFPWRKIGNK